MPEQPAPTTTAVAFVLGESGSMETCRDAAIQGFNAWLTAQQQLPDPCALTLVKFSARPDAPVCRLVHEHAPLGEVPPLTSDTYTPGGNTPLLDAVGRTIMWLDRLEQQPDRALVVILTDGRENASREFTPRQIRDLIRAHEALGTWTFAYLGADQNAWAEADHLGVARANATAFSKEDVRGAFDSVSAATRAYRLGRTASSRDFWATGRPGQPGTASSSRPAPQGKPASPSAARRPGSRPKPRRPPRGPASA